ncbi:MAG: RHS repeat protein, partial [Acidobacteriaceae bacterium]|nr:RHS repeat protein [Acidobacteriaceae bacterium]
MVKTSTSLDQRLSASSAAAMPALTPAGHNSSARRVAFKVGVALTLLFGSVTSADTPAPPSAPQRGMVPFGSYAFDKVEFINLQNGILSYNIPLTTMPLGRAGHTLSISARYSSSIADYYYYTQQQGVQTVGGWGMVTSPYGGWHIGPETYTLYLAPAQATCPGTNTTLATYNFFVIGPDGSSHGLTPYQGWDLMQFVNPGADSNACTGQKLPNPELFYTTDGTYIRVLVDRTSNRFKVLLRDGGVQSGKFSPTVGIVGTVDTVQDRNGNSISISLQSDGQTLVLTDDVGRSITVGPTQMTKTGANGSTLTWTYTSSQTSTFTINPPCPISTGCQSVIAGGIDTLTIPASSGSLAYRFSYNTQNGELQTVTLPSGASTLYTFLSTTLIVGNPIVSKVVTWVDTSDGGNVTRREPWSYDLANSSHPCSTNVTKPDGGIESQYFPCCNVSIPTLSGQIITDVQPNGDRVEYGYQNNAPLDPYGAGTVPADRSQNPYLRFTVHVKALGGSPSVAAVTEYRVDKNGNIVAATSYDWVPYSNIQHDASGMVTGYTASQVIRSTASTYQYGTVTAGDGSEQINDQANAYWNPSAPALLDLVTDQTITGSGTGSVAQYVYDAKGNPTQEAHWDSTKVSPAPAALSTANASVTQRTFDQYGNLTSETDPNGNVVSYRYDANSLYPTTKLQAGAALTYTWDFATGLMFTKLDLNGVAAQYGYDPLGRLTSVQEFSANGPPSRTTKTTYDDANRRVTVARDRDALNDGLLVNVTTYDELGRVALTQQLENAATQNPTDPTAGIKVQTRYLYSGSNLYKLVSNPYRAATSSVAGGESTMGWTVTTYDQEGRPVSVQSFGGSALPAAWGGGNTNSSGSIATSYSAQNTTVTDQAGHARMSTVDGLGRLVQVIEDPATSGLTTKYAYDVLDDLTSVNQSGQMRTFVYDSLKRLTSAANPESGTVQYIYDANGNVLSRTDANGKVTGYSYDALNRVTSKAYSDGTPRVTYVYDTVRFGELSEVAVQNGPVTDYTSYDGLARVTGSTQTAGGQTYNFSYTYNLTDQLTSETYPSGRTVSFAYDGADR